MADNTAKLVDHLTELELAAQNLLEDKQSIIALDRKRNQTREARTALKHKANSKTSHLNSNKTWVCCGNTFIKIPDQTVVTLLDKSYSEIDREILETREEMKSKLNKIRELEGKSAAAGFNLQALSSEEQKSLNTLL